MLHKIEGDDYTNLVSEIGVVQGREVGFLRVGERGFSPTLSPILKWRFWSGTFCVSKNVCRSSQRSHRVTIPLLDATVKSDEETPRIGRSLIPFVKWGKEIKEFRFTKRKQTL